MRLRAAELADADALLAWRNDPETRAASHISDFVDSAAHVEWLRRSLSNPDRKLFIAENDGVAVGTVRADTIAEAVTLISWTVAPEWRRKGLASQILSALFVQVSGVVCAEIKEDNVASRRIAECARMTLTGQRNGVLYYRLELARQTS